MREREGGRNFTWSDLNRAELFFFYLNFSEEGEVRGRAGRDHLVLIHGDHCSFAGPCLSSSNTPFRRL